MAEVFVVGATGRQGGAVVRHLLAAGFEVRAATRDPSKPSATALGELGARCVRADLDDPATLRPAMDGCAGVFSVQNYWEKGVGFHGEVRQGKALVDAAREVGVAHFVQASVAKGPCADAEHPEHFRCKFAVEDYAKERGLPWSAVRTVFFYDNFVDPNGGSLLFPLLTGALRPDLPFHGVVVDDIGRLVARMFAERDRYLGLAVDIASDVRTVGEMKADYEAARGRAPRGWRMPFFAVKLLNREFARQLAWNNEVGWQFSMDAVHEHLPEPTSFATYCRTTPFRA